MSRIQERFEIASSAAAVYDALSQPETIVGTLPGVSSIYRFDPTHYRVQVGSAGRARQLDIEIVDREPSRRLAWRSADGRWEGSVDLQPLGEERTLVLIAVHGSEEGASSPDNGEAASVIEASLQHLKSALQAETDEPARAGAAEDDSIHISRGPRGERRAEGEGRHGGESEWRGSQSGQSSFFSGEYPYAFMRMVSREMDRWWEQLQRGAAAARRTVGNFQMGLNPPIEICERPDELVVCVDVPGLERDDLRVEVDEGLLTIRGERKGQQEDPKSVRRTERVYGTFVRRIPLPEGLEIDHVRARLAKGVLEVHIPAPRARRPRTVDVESDTAQSKG